MSDRLQLLLLFLSAMSLTACGDSRAGSAPATPIQTPMPVSVDVGDYIGFSGQTAVTLIGYTGEAMEPFISKDGHYLFFNNSNQAANTDLFYALQIDGLTFQYQGSVVGANSPQLDAVASLDASGRLIFVSNRSYATSLSTLYSAQFGSGSTTAPTLLAGVSAMQAGRVNFDAEISGDGQTLYFDDGTYDAGGMLQAATLVVADRQGEGFVRRADSATLLVEVNAVGLNYAPAISADGLELFFTRSDPAVAGGMPSIYRAVRTAAPLPFGTVQRVLAATGYVEGPTLSADGHFLYYHRKTDAGFRLYHVQR